MLLFQLVYEGGRKEHMSECVHISGSEKTFLFILWLG